MVSLSSRETNNGDSAQLWNRHRDVLRECCVLRGEAFGMAIGRALRVVDAPDSLTRMMSLS